MLLIKPLTKGISPEQNQIFFEGGRQQGPRGPNKRLVVSKFRKWNKN